MAKRRKKGEERGIAARRIRSLLETARRESLGPDADLADRYGQLTNRIARRYQLSLRPAEASQVCRKCGTYRRATTSRTRVQRNQIITTCLTCGHTHRRPLHGQQDPPRPHA